jgi:hypothetical protein
MDTNKRFIYYPAFSSICEFLKRDSLKIGSLDTLRFYDDRFPERYQHKYFLLTAGVLYDQMNIREELGLDEKCIVFGDSGGYQIAQGTLEWNVGLRQKIFQFLERNSDVAANLDIPPNEEYRGRFDECLEISKQNFRYFNDYQSGKTKFLNVLQAEDAIEQYIEWYDAVKGFDFNGWAIGGTLPQHYNAIFVTALLLQNREFEKKSCEYIHFLGATSPANFWIYAAIQKNLNRYYSHTTVTTDSSTPLMQPVYGNWIHSLNVKTWSFNKLWVGNDGSFRYNKEADLPCIFDGRCAICANIKWKHLASYTSHEQFSVMMGWHNLFMFIESVNQISDIIYSGNDVLRGLVSLYMIKALKVIDEMFDNPEDAIKIFYHHRRLFATVSKRVFDFNERI